jgi:fatty-acyl-CoA synthase
VHEVAVFSAKDDQFGETPIAVIYGDAATISVPAIISHCNTHLANFKVPRYVAIEDAPLPRLPSGKISKASLRDKYKDAHTTLTKVR